MVVRERGKGRAHNGKAEAGSCWQTNQDPPDENRDIKVTSDQVGPPRKEMFADAGEGRNSVVFMFYDRYRCQRVVAYLLKVKYSRKEKP